MAVPSGGRPESRRSFSKHEAWDRDFRQDRQFP